MDLLHVHYEPPGDGPHPTIIALHGWGASALDLIALAPMLAAGRFQVICPQGPIAIPLGGAYGFGWFPLTGGQPGDPRATETAAAALVDFLQQALGRYPIDPSKLVLLGFSQGGALAYRLALAEPARFAGLVALSTWLPPQLLAQFPVGDAHRQLMTLIQHGSDDEIISVARARQSVESLRASRLPLTYREYDMGHEISARSLADLSAWLGEKILSPIIAV